MSEPSRVEVLAWMERTGCSPAEAVDHFWPGLVDAERGKRRAQIRQWAHRARGGADRPARRPTSRTSSPELTPRTSPVSSGTPAAAGDGEAVAREDVPFVDYLRRQLAELERDLELARATGQLRIVAQLDKRRSEVRGELEAALEPERRVLKLERTATAIALELERRSKAIAIRAEIERRRQGI